jgi:hypothetical protein
MSKWISITVALVLGGYAWANAAPERAARAQGRADTKAALVLRCEADDARAVLECKEVLTRRFASGSATPQAILRTHCTRWSGPFVEVIDKPPKLCVERFGGWLSG